MRKQYFISIFEKTSYTFPIYSVFVFPMEGCDCSRMSGKCNIPPMRIIRLKHHE